MTVIMKEYFPQKFTTTIVVIIIITHSLSLSLFLSILFVFLSMKNDEEVFVSCNIIQQGSVLVRQGQTFHTWKTLVQKQKGIG